MSTGRYQSRLFSYLSQQSLRLQDKANQAWRQVKIATVWGVQIALYPIYFAFQSTRLVNRQLRQAVRQVVPQLKAVQQGFQEGFQAGKIQVSEAAQPLLTADTPIRNTLETVQALLSDWSPISSPPDRFSPNQASQSHPSERSMAKGAIALAPGHPLIQGSSSQPITHQGDHSDTSIPTHITAQPAPSSAIQIRGIASLLDNKGLVLVTVDNQILDILPVEQQAYLQRRVTWEVANYWRQRRVLGGMTGQHSLKGSFPVSNFLPLPSDRPNALLPIRGFHRLMAWMQSSPVAIATNLFQESQLALLHAAESQAIANLPASERALRSAELPWLSLEEAFGDLFRRSAQAQQPTNLGWRDRIKTHATELVQRPARAITRLLQGSSVHHPASSPSSSSTPPPTSPQPWLTMENLFGGKRQSSAKTPEWELFDTTTPKQITKKAVSIGNRGRATHPVLSSSPDLTHSTAIAPQESTSATVTTSPSEPQDSAITTTYIDAEVKLVTYVKHPLEQLLEWLDQGMVWIEEKLAQVLKWLRNLV